MYLPGKRNRSNVREQTRDTFLIGYHSATGLKYVYPNPAHCENVFTDGKCPRMNEKPGKLSIVQKSARTLNSVKTTIWIILEPIKNPQKKKRKEHLCLESLRVEI